MKISVIMPAYNRAYIIQDAIRSVLAQTFSDFELLLVDDSSNDGTWEIMQSIRDARVRCFRREQRGNPSIARNLALREVAGDFISFLDSDDLWKPNKLERDMLFLEAHPEADAVFADLEKEDGVLRFPSFMRETAYFSKMLAEKNYPNEIVFTQRETYLCLLKEVHIKPTALTLRTPAVRKTGFFDESKPAGRDWEFLLRFAREFRFGYIDEPLTTIRVQRDSVHRAHVVVEKSATLELFKREIEFAISRGDNEAINAAKRGYADMSKFVAWAHLGAGQKSAAAMAFVRAFRETGKPSMLARAVSAYFPRNLRAPLKRAIGRQEN